MGDIVLTLNELHVLLHHEGFLNVINIFKKTTHDTHSCNIVKILFCVFDAHFMTSALKLRCHACRAFKSAFNMMNGIPCMVKLKFTVENLKFQP